MTEDKLADYRAKRDFGVTPEPADAPADEPAERPRFVIQEHHATRLHWDLRLEHEGTLASWAVPNALPHSPGENRLAVRTEDHPLEYLHFHGVIPEGNYGAGKMTIWDQGTFELLKWEPRKVEVHLHGERVSGRYALFPLDKGEQPKDWMIHRMDPPEDPGREPLPEFVIPMTARDGEPEGEGWSYEALWPGLRVLVRSLPGRMALLDETGEDVSDAFPELRRFNRALSHHEALLDAVLVCFGPDGRPDRRGIERRLAPGLNENAARRRAKADPARLVTFDVLHLDGRSLCELSYHDRRSVLEQLGLPDVSPAGPAPEPFAAAGFARAIAKRGPYVPGAPGWRRIALREDVPEPEPEVHLTNPGKVLYPSGFTKREVFAYYEAVAPVLVPHYTGRPLTLKRYPNGVAAGHFYEKNCPSHRPDWVRTQRVGDIDFCLLEDRRTLLWVAQLASLELHPSLSLAAEIQRPTLLVFDLDPGEGVDIAGCCELAVTLRDMLAGLGLRSVAKTSGSKGLQVYVPLNNDSATYAQTKPFARAVAETLERAFPDRVVSKMTKALRPGKILVDWSQNDAKKTTVGVYSLRAKERPTVSTPLTWEEVETADAAALAFTAPEVLERVERHGDLFRPALELVQVLPA